MLLVRILTLRGPLAELDEQIEKFRGLADEYKESNKKYYGEYLSRILYDEDQ